jgi:hypothetical protein
MSRARARASFLVLLAAGAPFLRRRPRPDLTARLTLSLIWQAACGLLATEPEMSCYFATRALVLAAAQGERAVYGQALGWHLALFTTIFDARRSRIIEWQFARARSLARSPDPWSEAFVRTMHGAAKLLWSDTAGAYAMCSEVAQRRVLDSPLASSVRMAARCVTIGALNENGRVGLLSQLAEPWLREAIDGGDRHMEVTVRMTTALARHLRRDDPEAARAELDLASGIELDYEHFAVRDPVWYAGLWLYVGQPARGLAHCELLQRQLPQYVLHSDSVRLGWLGVQGQCAAGMAALGQERVRALDLLQACAQRATRLRTSNAPLLAAQLQASACFLRGEHEPAASHARRALALADALDQKLVAASLRRALVRLGAPDSATLEHAAARMFADEGIAHPQRWAQMHLPGVLYEG